MDRVKMEIEDSNEEEIDMEEHVIIDENNTEVLSINNDSNIQLEFFDIKNLPHDDSKSPEEIERDNERLRKELTYTQEKFSILQSQTQHQGKMIELLLRLDLIKSYEDPDKKELEDLQRKVQLCSSLIEECNIKFREISNEKRRLLIVDNEPSFNKSEKKAAVWEHFTILVNTDGYKTAECNFCGKNFNYRSLNANKCRDHIFDKCEKVPDTIKKTSKPRYELPSNKSKYTVWNYFNPSIKDGKSVIECMFCGAHYTSRNATKCREHLAFKCSRIPDKAKAEMRSTFSSEYIENLTTAKRSSIWEHFSVQEDDDKVIIKCLYCCMNYANKNATKCREHLLDRCDKIPLHIRHKINNSFYDLPLKTWTQIKIPIWRHFSVVTSKDRRQFKCNYCQKVYSSKNVTKFRLHLLYKCEKISDEMKDYINLEISKSSSKNESATYFPDEQLLNESQNIDDSGHSFNDDDNDEEEKMMDDENGSSDSEVRITRSTRSISKKLKMEEIEV